MAEDRGADIAWVQERVSQWQQGDVAELTAVAHVADLERPLTPAAAELRASGRSGQVQVITRAESVVVLTQTCDLVRDPTTHSFVEVCPLVRLREKDAALGRKGWLTDYAYVPGLGEDSFANLGRAMTVEKSVIARLNLRRGCRTDSELRAFAEQVARRYVRFAFPDSFVATIAPLRNRLRNKHGKDSSEGRAAESVWQIRATPLTEWNATSLEVWLDFILPPRPIPLAEDEIAGPESVWPGGLTVREWDVQIDRWLSLCERQGTVAGIDGAASHLDDVNPRAFYFGDQLDLDYLSMSFVDGPAPD